MNAVPTQTNPPANAALRRCLGVLRARLIGAGRGMLIAGWMLGAVQPTPILAESTIFGGGPFYSGGVSTMNALRASGYTTVMLWCIHVNETTGNLIFNDQLVVADGAYVGNVDWPGQLALLKVPPTSVTRIEVSVGSWGVNDFQAIETLMNTYGTNSGSILYRNFQALKNATGADAIDFDDETHYDVDTAVRFGRMLSAIGYKITLCPYTNPSFWQNVYQQLGPGIVDAVYLQCYAGGGGNNPASWNGYFSGLTVQPGMWCKHGGGCSEGSSAAEVQAQMTAWRESAAIPGGFMWLYDDMLACTTGGSPADYARAINTAVDPLRASPATGFSAVAAHAFQALPASTPFLLTNEGTTALNWSLINTAAWLNVSASSGSIGASGSGSVTVSLDTNVAVGLAPGSHSASVLFSNHTTGITFPRDFSLNTAVVNWPVTLTGWNAALLAPNTATPAQPGATAFDVPNNYCFYQAGLPGSTRGLPVTGVFPSLCDRFTAFQLRPYGAPNALLLGYTAPQSGMLTLTSPQPFNALAVLACSANGGGQGTLVIHFEDGSDSPVFNFNAHDWFHTVTNVALQGFGRLRLGASFTIEDNGDSNPNLYQTTVNLAALGLTQAVASITFSMPPNAGASQNTAVFAVSGMPSGIPLTPPTGLSAAPGTNATVSLSWDPSAGAAAYRVQRSSASGGGYATVANTVDPAYTDTGLVNGSNYYYVVAATGPGNVSSNSSEVSAMPGSYRAWSLAADPVAYWPLGETVGTTAYDLVAGHDGQYAGGYVLGVPGTPGAGFQNLHRAAYYLGATGYTQVPRVIGDTSFSIVFWVRTIDSGGSPQWYQGKGLVDGEVGGVADDFGVSLVGSKVGFGVGSPDTTLVSARSINNNAWHQVVVTRDSGTGALKIYIDGTLDAGGPGPTGARAASPVLRIACLQTGINHVRAYLSDVALYDQVLTADQVTTLYRAATGLFHDVTLTRQWDGSSLLLIWPGNGTLLEATNLFGPWATNPAASPANITPLGPRKFYRIQTW